ncbi:MAG: hypothetical protein KAU03_06765, partial [Candidatus Altiarchaeales archaeon]|nr:hypothetical protein [Candidatus Altiarchaeales archaeon]
MRKFSIFLALAIVLMVVTPQVCATISETVHSSSVTKKVGVTSESGSHTDTHASDNKYHYSRISSNRGYLDYSFISSYTSHRIEKLEYKTELKIGSTYESVSVQIWNWKTLKWETLWGDLHHMSEQKHTHTITSSPWNYMNGNTGEIKIRYYYYQHQPPRVWIDHQSITVEADKSKPSLSPKEPHLEEIHVSSRKKYGVTSETGDYQKTYVSDNGYHYFRVGNLHGSLEYEFTTANTNHKLVKLQYQTEPKIGSTYESVSVQIWNWKTLKWETIWGDLHHMSEHVHTWETTSTNYLSKERHVRIRYYYHQHQPPRVWIDHQRLMFYFDTTQSGEYPSEFDPCEEHFESSSDETRVGVTSETGDHARTRVSDNNYHYFRVGNSGGYLVYDFKTGIKTTKESTPEDYLSNSVLKRVGVTSETGDHTRTRVSDNN